MVVDRVRTRSQRLRVTEVIWSCPSGVGNVARRHECVMELLVSKWDDYRKVLNEVRVILTKSFTNTIDSAVHLIIFRILIININVPLGYLFRRSIGIVLKLFLIDNYR